MKRIATALAIAILVGVVVFRIAFPTYDYRYRLHLALEIDGKPYSGSSVVDVSWSCGPKIADSGCSATLAGQATAIDLGSKGVLVATLHSGEFASAIPVRGVDASFLCANAFGNQSTHKELSSLPRLAGKRALSHDNFPCLLWFPKPEDPKSVTRVDLETISSQIDPTASFSEAAVEITRDPIVIDITTKLPWLAGLLREKSGAVTVSPGRINLIHNMFVGEAT
jgi:hypothetical protein